MWNEFPRLGSRRQLRRGAIVLGFVLLVWLLVLLMVAYRLTHRPRPRFEEPAPRIAWGPLEDYRIKTSDGEELGAWFLDSRDDSPSVLVLHGNNTSRWAILSAQSGRDFAPERDQRYSERCTGLDLGG
jgi:hypothetical protein